jgi:hypothetical protein
LGALKPGWQTTEFIVTVATAVGLIFASSADWLPPRYAALGSAISVGSYAIARGLAKINPPKDSTTPPPS